MVLSRIRIPVDQCDVSLVSPTKNDGRRWVLAGGLMDPGAFPRPHFTHLSLFGLFGGSCPNNKLEAPKIVLGSFPTTKEKKTL
jgi:hypothetical protein